MATDIRVITWYVQAQIHTNVDLVFQQNSINYMILNAGLSSVDINASLGIRSNIYNSIDNVDVSFRRNNLGFFCIYETVRLKQTPVFLYILLMLN